MFGRYRFRVQIPTSGARFVPGHGILSQQALEQLSEFPDRSPFDMKVDIPDPKVVRDNSMVIQHLRGDHVQTPFVSVTADLYRAFSIAAHEIRKSIGRSGPPTLNPDHVLIFVVDTGRLENVGLSALEYLTNVPRPKRTEIAAFNKLINSININQEVIIHGGIPEDAIVRQIPMSRLLPFFPSWFRGPDGHFMLPNLRDQVHRKWIRACAKKYIAFVKKGGDPKAEARRFAEVLLGDAANVDGEEAIKSLSELLETGPKEPSKIDM